MPQRLVDRTPRVPAARLIAEMVPPPRFAGVSFDSYVPDPAQPSQADAVRAGREFATSVGMAPRRSRWRRRRRRGERDGEPGRGLYLDGGFGVGKTHLLASAWHAAPVPADAKAFCTFVELTNLVGALGFGPTVEALAAHRLLCIDEFELDDPGDTVLVSTLLSRLTEQGVRVAATSNTLPGRLGEGRFAAEDFLREIQQLAERFEVLRVDGDDYRHRGLAEAPAPASDESVTAAADTPGATLDDFDALCAHLAEVHPSRYGPLLDGVTRVHLRGVRTVDDQHTALRLVVLADRLYDRDVPVLAGGVALDRLFADELLTGGYRKKYYRAVSRLVALSRDGAAAT
ncbi:cell division protein ZapE [Haloactinopolyspora alba]|uniref:Cell division protein ZapE n=1 Tax=Haloactinopolyspora alba TaxID=648780 RepID=A0A2P8DIF2_9ACTN|nr:cell division protein ZapE [Haloactinopolyspora alba]PSK96978.1 cell division protein ZapE [Haloactinopolyspora alba]